jgi:hypothetical protein
LENSSLINLEELAKKDKVNNRDRTRCLNQNLNVALTFCVGGTLPLGYVISGNAADNFAGWQQAMISLFGVGTGGIGVWGLSKTVKTYLNHFKDKNGEEGYAYLDGKISDRITAVEKSFGHQIIPVDHLEVLNSQNVNSGGFYGPLHFLDHLVVKDRNVSYEEAIAEDPNIKIICAKFSDDKVGMVRMGRLNKEIIIPYNFGNRIPAKFEQMLGHEGEFSLLFKLGKTRYEGDHQTFKVQEIYN